MTEAAAQGEQRHGSAITGMLSDDHLARRAVVGDERAFAAIFRRYHQRLYRFCLAIVGDAEDAQDALQNTMVKVLRALPGEARAIQLKPWLYRIAHNESVELLRRRRDTGPLDPELAAPGAGLAEEAATRARLRHLFADLEELPERQRGALLMRELSGLDFGEIAAALGTSPAVARQTLYEARLSLRQMDEGREMSCQTVTRALSDGDGRVIRRRDLRAHLRTCADCRRFRDQTKVRERDLGALAPLPVTVAAGILHGLLGTGQSAGGGLAGVAGGGVAKSAGASALLKGAATVAVVAAVGVGVADRGGLIHVGLPGDTSSPATKTQAPAAGDRAAESQAGPPPPRQTAAGSVSQRSTLVRGAARLGAAAKAPEAGVHPPSPAPATPAPAASSDSVAAHPSGKGHEKQHPSAAAKGQQTAAAHKAAGHGAGDAKSHPAHPPKPPHPASSNKGAGRSSHPSEAKSEAGSKAAAAPAAPGEGASPGHESGKKP